MEMLSDNFGENPQHEFGQVFDDGMLPILPYWRLEGDAYATTDFVRVVPDRQSKRGGLWNTMPNHFSNWEMVTKLRISGTSHMGADGMGMWYVSDPSHQTNEFFGYKEKFLGLGVIIDTYDNDKSGKHPKMIGVLNDGSKSFTHSHNDKDHHDNNMELGNCYFGLRNQKPVTLKVTYLNKHLTVAYENSGTLTTCFTYDNIFLPPGYFFGITAATGQLADDHDVYAVALRNLDENAQQIDSVEMYGRQVTIHQLTGILSKIEHAVYERTEKQVSNKVPLQSTPVIHKPISHSTPTTEVKCDISSISTDVHTIQKDNEQVQSKITEILKTVQNIQQDIRKNADSSQTLTELAKIESMLSSVKQSSARVEDITADKTNSYIWTTFCIFVVLVLVYIVRVFYIMRKDSF